MASLGLLAGVLLAGCAVPTAGTADPDPAAVQRIENGPLTAKMVFGDYPTVDPCSVVDVHKLPSADAASLEPADAFDDCTMSVTINGIKTDVSVGPLSSPGEENVASKVVKSLRRGLTLRTDTNQSPGFCYDYIRFADGLDLQVYAAPHDATTNPDVCPAAEQIAEATVNLLGYGTAKHRTLPANSFGKVNPCNLVPADTLTAITEGGVHGMLYPQGHECFFVAKAGPNGLRLRVQFLIGTAPAVGSSSDSMTQIAGRNTLVSWYPNSTIGPNAGLCYLQAAGRPYGKASDHLVEIAVIDVHTGSAATMAACDAAKAVAAAAWPKLPAAG